MGNREFARKLIDQAVAAATDKSKPSNLQTAYQLFASACVADPTYGEAHYIAANNAYELKCFDTAIAGYRRALQCDIDDDLRASASLNMAWAFYSLGKVEEAWKYNEDAGRLKPTLAHYWTHKSILCGRYGDGKGAVGYAEEAVELAEKELANGPVVSAHPAIGHRDLPYLERQLLETRICLAFACLHAGDYHRGYDLFELRFEWRLHHFLKYPYQKWRGEPGIVFLCADQGLGDTLSYARFVERACQRATYVHAYVQPALMRLLMHSLGHLPNLNLIPYGNAYPQADYWTTFVSLPFALGLSDDEVRNQKHIRPSTYRLPTTWMVPDVDLHIGIAWAGSPLNDIDKDRNIPLQQFLKLYQVPGIQLYSLQVGERVAELHNSGAVALIRDLAPYINDVCDTISLLQNLDLVITVESALGHICALANKECWIPYSYIGSDYRIGYIGDRMLWTPKTKVFRQDITTSWDPVFKEIIDALHQRVDQAARSRSKRVSMG